MALVAPVNLPYNIKTLWFDPNGVDAHADDKVVVQTARGTEMGVMAAEPFEVPYEDIKKLKGPLRPVKRVATPEDEERAAEMEQKGRDAMPVFKKLSRETSEDMHPVSVEYMLDGEKAVFYFESEERIDFRELVRKLAAEFHVRIDMRQIGVRDEARIVGGIGHCGQMVCCKRLGGEFKPVSIRMAKDQDLSLNPQKISGLCGRLMCCLRYENDVYKEFKKAAPKMDAKVSTPDGEGRVVEYDVPRDTISVRVGDEKPVKVPLGAVTDVSEDRKSAHVGDEAWEEAVEAAQTSLFGSGDLFVIPSFTGEDKLGSATAVHHESSKAGRGKLHGSDGSSAGSKGGSGGGRKGRSRSKGRRGDGSNGGDGGSTEPKRTPRRRSTTIKADGETKQTKVQKGTGGAESEGAGSSGGGNGAGSKGSSGNGGSGAAGNGRKKQQRSRQQRGQQGAQQRSSQNRSKGKQASKQQHSDTKGQKLRPGHKSSGLAHGEGDGPSTKQGNGGNRRRRRRKPSNSGNSNNQS